MRVAINGIGVAGPTLAYWLRRAGHHPVLFEDAPAPRSGGYLIDFWGLGYEIAERMDLIPALRECCYEIDRMLMVDDLGREQAVIGLKSIRELLRGRFISLARADLAAALLAVCKGIPAHFGLSVTAIEQDDTDVVATLSNGRRERFDLVVGADGLHSKVREIAFGPEAQFEKSLDCYIGAFRISAYPRRDDLTYVSLTVPKRHVARVALRNDETLILLICSNELIDGNAPRHLQRAALRQAFGDMGWEVPDMLRAMDHADDVYFDRVSQIHVPRWSSGRVALIGDAAACPSLLAGEGTGLAMTEAYVLAGELHRTGGDFGRAFAAYDARLRAFVTAKQKGALWFRGFFTPQTAFVLKVRNLAVDALSLPFVSKRILARSLRDDLELPVYSTS